MHFDRGHVRNLRDFAGSLYLLLTETRSGLFHGVLSDNTAWFMMPDRMAAELIDILYARRRLCILLIIVRASHAVLLLRILYSFFLSIFLSFLHFFLFFLSFFLFFFLSFY